MTVECIFDTGSMVSTITESFYNKSLCDIPIVQECHLKLRAANGLEIPYVGYIEADVYVQPVNLRLEKRGILIVKDTQGREIPGLLGMNYHQGMQGPCDKWMWVSSTKVIQNRPLYVELDQGIQGHFSNSRGHCTSCRD